MIEGLVRQILHSFYLLSLPLTPMTNLRNIFQTQKPFTVRAMPAKSYIIFIFHLLNDTMVPGTILTDFFSKNRIKNRFQKAFILKELRF